MDWLKHREELRIDAYSIATALFKRFISTSLVCHNEDIKMLTTYFSKFNQLLSKKKLDKADIEFTLSYFTTRHVKDILSGRNVFISDGIANYISVICNRKLKMILGKDLKKSEIKEILNSIK